VIADILLDEAVAIMTADNGVGQIHVFDDGLELSAVLFRDLAAEDHSDLVGLSDGSIGVQQPISHAIQCDAAAEDEVVAEFNLGEEQPMLATSVFAFSFGEEGIERG